MARSHFIDSSILASRLASSSSVYRRFETPEDFREALQEVKAKKRRK